MGICGPSVAWHQPVQLLPTPLESNKHSYNTILSAYPAGARTPLRGIFFFSARYPFIMKVGLCERISHAQPGPSLFNKS